MAVITISRQFGAAGRSLGMALAKRLNHEFFDETLLRMIAQNVKSSVENVADFEKHEKTLNLSRIISGSISPAFIERLMDDKKGYLDEDVYIESLYKAMEELYAKDNVTILGRGGQFILKGRERAYHILLIARLEDRIQFICENYMMSADAARDFVLREDKRRAQFYKRLGKENYEDPRLYHVVINMSKVGLKKAEDMVVDLVR
jgi:cytidylate kinase